MTERWSTRLPESMTLPKGEKHHFIIQCHSHPLSLSNMPYVPVTGRLAGLSSVTGLFTHCSQSDTISCRKKKNHHHSTVTGCQAEGTNLHRALAESLPSAGGEGGKGQGLRWETQRRHPHVHTPHAHSVLLTIFLRYSIGSKAELSVHMYQSIKEKL